MDITINRVTNSIHLGVYVRVYIFIGYVNNVLWCPPVTKTCYKQNMCKTKSNKKYQKNRTRKQTKSNFTKKLRYKQFKKQNFFNNDK